MSVKAGKGFTRFQVDFLLSGGAQTINRMTRANWMADERFVEILELIKAGRSRSTNDMIEKAVRLINAALDGDLSEDDSPRLSAAMKLIARFPDPTDPVIVFRRWGSCDDKKFPEEKRRRIYEEIENDKDLKTSALPVDHVGHTWLAKDRRKGEIEEDEEL